MRKQTQRIIAIVLIAIIGVGAGLGAYFFLIAEEAAYNWVAPGAPAGTPQNRILKFGVLDDTEYITGEGAYNGAWLAAYEINTRGGVVIDNVTYYVGVASEDTDESNPALDLARGVSAAERLLNYKKAEFFLGGFRTEALQAYREVIMDAKKLFFITGSATAKFCQDVYNNYDRYKYTFRIQPLNEVFLATEVIRALFYTIYDLHKRDILNVTKVAIMRENLAWTQRMKTSIAGLIPLISLYVYGDYTTFTLGPDIAYPQTATPVDFYGYWSQVKASGAQITIPIISGPTGLYYSDVYGDTDQPSLSLGINVMGQQNIFWQQTGGNCEYEIAMCSFIKHAKTPYTISFWDHYEGNFSKAPIYTAIGGYDAVNTMAYAMWAAQSLDTEDILTQLEESEWQGLDPINWTIPTGTPRTEYLHGIGSPTTMAGFWTDGTYQRDVDSSTPTIIDYTRHDSAEGSDPLGHAVFVQWVKDPLHPGQGKWECIPCGGLPYLSLYYPPLASWEDPMYADQPWGQVVTANITLPKVPR
jgi:branched-chain amino acid transport system substrate-binding protein